MGRETGPIIRPGPRGFDESINQQQQQHALAPFFMMDQEQASEALTASTSFSARKLNAEAPEFVPRSSATAPPQQSVLQNVYARPPPFVSPLPPPYYGYENFYQQPPMQFYGYNSNPLSPVELAADRNNGSPAAATKNGLSDVHLKILNQVEFYFSDINLATTDQLFRFMSKDPEGYVPISVVASFKKIKSAINGSAELASILQSSKKLLVSEDGKMVKRRHPLTESDMEELQSRIVITENLPEDHSHQNLMRIFSSVGSVKSIRTCPPQNPNNSASSAFKTGKGDAMHFNSKLHAFVEFESVELAEKAVIELTDEGNWRNGLKVRLLLKSVVKPTQGRGRKIGNEGHPVGRKDEATIPEMQCSDGSHLEDSQLQSDSQFHEHQGRPFQQREDSGTSNVQRKGRNNIAGNGKAKAKSKGKGQGQGQGRGRPQHLINGGIYPPPIEVSVSSEKPTTAKTSPVPRMPDGTKGFSMGRGKPVNLKIA
ncbi:La-related protein 6B [Sesamum angolense]|uniref:La-related protein 6B n=1 Tax=Sesamum angolense TaxID=2727404 RepID=A0AAE2BZM7_9LAMI|nr:La-related protein 6B [Sesamum angolense]